jgi:hypothetical protein
MTSPSPPPSRRKRRFVIMIAALLVVSLCTWWYWPRGDARFVGKWSATSPVRPAIAPVWIFDRYGRGILPTPTGTVGLSSSWEVRGTTLELSWLNNGRTLDRWLKCEWELLWGKLTTGQDSSAESYEILDVGPDEISLNYVGSGYQPGPVTLRRIKERTQPHKNYDACTRNRANQRYLCKATSPSRLRHDLRCLQDRQQDRDHDE